MTAAEILTVREEDRWQELLPPSSSVFGSVEFARIQQRHAGVEPRLFTLGSPGGSIVHPLNLRPVAELAFAPPSADGLYDASSPPYSGPLAVASPDPATRAAFSEALAGWCADAGVVTEFDHLHPWKARTELLDAEGLELDREIVYVDLTQDPERLWRESLTHACRKNVKRARREGVRVRAAETAADARELQRIYELTMDRQGALEDYYFPPEYFISFLERLPDNSRILLAEHEDRVVAATLYLYDRTDAYSYLGGADHAYQRVRPTNAIVYEMIRWAAEHGVQRLVLGGGYGPDDGILRFKASFSPLRAPFHVQRRVRLPDAYAELCEAWSDRHGERAAAADYFPRYRAASTPSRA
jgi:Acetyltransferase (GNAT) domain